MTRFKRLTGVVVGCKHQMTAARARLVSILLANHERAVIASMMHMPLEVMGMVLRYLSPEFLVRLARHTRVVFEWLRSPLVYRSLWPNPRHAVNGNVGYAICLEALIATDVCIYHLCDYHDHRTCAERVRKSMRDVFVPKPFNLKTMRADTNMKCPTVTVYGRRMCRAKQLSAIRLAYYNKVLQPFGIAVSNPDDARAAFNTYLCDQFGDPVEFYLARTPMEDHIRRKPNNHAAIRRYWVTRVCELPEMRRIDEVRKKLL